MNMEGRGGRLSKGSACSLNNEHPPDAAREAVTTPRARGAGVQGRVVGVTLRRVIRSVALVATGSAVVFMAVLEWSRGDRLIGLTGGDRQTYMDAAARWLGGGSFYLPYQLAGPYDVLSSEVMYPPTSIPLFALMSMLPAILWWLPVPVILGAVAWHRPNPLALGLIVVAATTPWAWAEVALGNPVMWAAAALALGTVWGWPAAAVMFKPSIAPFALLGIRSRGWWLCMLAGVLIAVVMLPLWPQWIAVLQNARGPRVGLFYSIGDVSIMAVPLLAWLGSHRRQAILLNQSTSTKVPSPDPLVMLPNGPSIIATRLTVPVHVRPLDSRPQASPSSEYEV